MIRNDLAGLLAGALLLLAGCSQMPANLPALSDNHQHRPGQVIWHDLLSERPDQAREFYQQLFGWQFTLLPNALARTEYFLISHQGQAIGGLVDTRNFSSRENLSQWISVFSSTDLDRSLQQVKNTGGKVIGGPKSLGERGDLAVVSDPQGAVFALLATRSGDPLASPQRPGYFLWQELWNTQGEGDFYQQLFNSQNQSLTLNGQQYPVYTVDGKPTYAIQKSPLEGLKPTWVSYIQVADVAATASRAEALGGRLVVPPQANPPGGQLAVIQDPAGAGFVIQSWQEQ